MGGVFLGDWAVTQFSYDTSIHPFVHPSIFQLLILMRVIGVGGLAAKEAEGCTLDRAPMYDKSLFWKH